MSDSEEKSILEQLGEEFESQIEVEKSTSHSKGGSIKDILLRIKKSIWQNRKRAISITCVVAVLVLTVAGILWANRSKVPEIADMRGTIPGFLTEEEKTDWEHKEVDKDEIYVMVNASLNVDEEDTVQLRLANPPYCAYPLKITICDVEDTKKIYYESDVLNPGDSIEEAKLKELPEKEGTYGAVIQYQFFAAKGNDSLVGEHTVNADLIIH